MGHKLRFLILSTSSAIASAKVTPAREMVHLGDLTEYVSKFVQIDGLDAPVVESHECPRGFSLDLGDDEEGIISSYPNGKPLRYTYASEITQIEMPDYAHAFDRAMYVYMCELARLEPDLPIVLYYWY